KIPIHKCIQYTDNALRGFFKRASREPWFKNTLFVITADHTAQAMADEYKTDYGMYKIPMIFYHPNADTAYRSNHIFQQIDLMPTLIDYLKLNESYACFGKSIYQTEGGFHVAYRNGWYQLLKDGYLLRFNNEKFEIFDVEKDPMLAHNIAKDKNDKALEDLKQYLKAIIQQYNNRLIENRLNVNENI
ncbi:MAG: sulfatase-like hydrolase/transferase, partial [Bacteroidales bacterium]|nr:sulfatase-like hydrolase/transferase [Bacteroidales bacterium]